LHVLAQAHYGGAISPCKERLIQAVHVTIRAPI
jgi:hypothetical protein